jgi:hydrogenase nickel incorporation protein HypB
MKPSAQAADGHAHEHVHADGTRHSHDHGHEHGHDHAHEHRHSYAPAHSHAPGLGAKRMVQIEQDILAKNNAYAAKNRERLAGSRRICAEPGIESRARARPRCCARP